MQSHCFPQPQAGAVKHQYQCPQHCCPDPATMMFARRMQKLMYLLLREDVWKKRRFLDWRERMLGNISGRMVAAPVEAQLTNHPKFLAYCDRLASGDT